MGYTNKGAGHKVIADAIERRQAESLEHLRVIELEQLDQMYAARPHRRPYERTRCF